MKIPGLVAQWQTQRKVFRFWNSCGFGLEGCLTPVVWTVRIAFKVESCSTLKSGLHGSDDRFIWIDVCRAIEVRSRERRR
jgi:hypothetical protein